jgi:exodeoxyribonuclease-3
MLSIASWNVNGIRACHSKGALKAYLETVSPDIVGLQEIKADESVLPEELINPHGYYSIYYGAERKGYSGVGILTKHKPLNVVYGFGNPRFDCEGRVVAAEFEDFIFFSVYFPNGQSGPERLAYKLDFYQAFFDHCDELRAMGKHVVIAGDYNTAHHEIDLARPKDNEDTSGFLPIEREWLDRIVRRGYVDTFRAFHTQPNEYSWWSFRAGARQRNVGWRIDYVFVDEALMPRVTEAYIHQKVLGSDHCPVGICFL